MGRVSLLQPAREGGAGLDRVGNQHMRRVRVRDEVYEDARKQFSEKELAGLTLAVAAINAWNRLASSAQTEPGKYQPAKEHPLKKGLSGEPGSPPEWTGETPGPPLEPPRGAQCRQIFWAR